MQIDKQEATTLSSNFYLQLDHRTDDRIQKRKVARVNMHVHNTAGQADRPVDVIEIDIARLVLLLPQNAVLRQLNRDDGTAVQSFILSNALFGGIQGTSPFLKNSNLLLVKPYLIIPVFIKKSIYIAKT